MNKIIYILRHANSIGNKEKIFQGKSIDLGLSDIGKEQKKIVLEYFKNIDLDLVYSSESKRSIDTINDVISDKKIELIKTACLNEVGLGVLEGKKKSNKNKLYYNKIIENWKSGNSNFTFNNSEKLTSIKDRLKTFISKEIVNSESDSILIVSHSRIIKFLLIFLFKEKLENIDRYNHKNIHLYKIICSNKKNIIIYSKILI